MTPEELAEKLTETVMMLAEENRWPVKRFQMQSVIQQTLIQEENETTSTALTDWQNGVDGKINELIKDWEGRMPDDGTLYTLGLRRALDVVRGVNVETS